MLVGELERELGVDMINFIVYTKEVLMNKEKRHLTLYYKEAALLKLTAPFEDGEYARCKWNGWLKELLFWKALAAQVRHLTVCTLQ